MTQAQAPQAPQARERRPLSDQVVVRCTGVTKIFRDFWMRHRVRAVDSVDLDIRRGEVFGLLGPNGSGKSTTIKMILGLLHPTAGRISVFGKRPEDVATKRLIGYLPEESYLYRFLNARETLEYYSKLFHQSGAQSKRRIDMLLEMVGLESAQRRPVGEYSKGMQRRIGLAQALINDPQLLILDEPTTGLDPIGTKQIKDLIVELASRGKTILLCSHLLSDVEDVCDRVSIMFGGKVRAQGTCDELLVQQDATTIQTPALDEDTISEIEQVLARRGLAIDRVDQPRQRLEQLFLDIVHRAQKEGAATSGARAGGRIADFLVTDESSPEQQAAQSVVDALLAPSAGDADGAKSSPSSPSASPVTKPSSAAAVTGATAAATAAEAGRAAQTRQSAVVDELVQASSAPASPASTSAPAPVKRAGDAGSAKPAPPEADLSLINELVGQRTAPTPQRIEPTVADKSAGASSTKPAEDASRGSGEDSGGDSGEASEETSGGGGGERPDTSFLDAINQVPPYDESRDKPGKKS